VFDENARKLKAKNRTVLNLKSRGHIGFVIWHEYVVRRQRPSKPVPKPR
jgi:hypothetical protein